MKDARPKRPGVRIVSQPPALTAWYAVTHWSYGTQVWPRLSPQSAWGVFQKLIES
jgi:hypothetical protein